MKTQRLGSAGLVCGGAMLWAWAMGGCTPGAIGGAAQPHDVHDALGDSAFKCDQSNTPEGNKLAALIIDWPATQRGELESAMHDGVAVVKYTCDGVEILSDCRVGGDYGYRGLSVKKEAAFLDSTDQLAANFGTASMGVKADFKAGAKLDLLTYLVGKHKTTRMAVYQGELPGEGCEGATHFVRQADVGAFAMTSGTEVQAGAAAQAFGQGVSGASSSKETHDTSDGDPDKCKAGETQTNSPPAGCNAMVRVKLFPIKPGQPPAKAEQEAGVDDPIDCPAGFVNVDSLCQPEDAQTAYRLCDKGDAEQCKEQCLKGSDESCGRFGNLSKHFKDASEQFKTRLEQACKAGVAAACSGLYWAIYLANKLKYKALQNETIEDEAVKKRKELQPITDQLDALSVNGCIGGDAESCRIVTQEHYWGSSPHLRSKDQVKFFSVMRRACEAGSAFACWRHAVLSLDGGGDVGLALKYLDRACMGQYLPACVGYAALHSSEADCKALQDAARRCDWQQAGTNCRQLRVHDIAAGPGGQSGGEKLCSAAVLGAVSGDKAAIADKYLALGCRTGSDSSIFVNRNKCK